MPSHEIVLCAPVRTAIGTFNGSLKAIQAVELGATVVRAVLERSRIDPLHIDSVLMGNVVQAGNRMNPARQAGIYGGLPVDVPAMTLNRVCGSGAQAIVSAAHEIRAGESEIVLAGGMENMDLAPYLMPSARWGARMGHAQIYDSLLHDGLNDAFSNQHSGWHTEDLARDADITRAEQDRWSVRSQERFAQAQAAGLFQEEIVGVSIPEKGGARIFDRDEANRPGTTLEGLGKLKPAFRPDGTITAGNAPGLNSGAAALLVADRDAAGALASSRSHGWSRLGWRRSSPRCLAWGLCQPSVWHWNGPIGAWATSTVSRSTKPSPQCRLRWHANCRWRRIPSTSKAVR